jgi:hypothetical protein
MEYPVYLEFVDRRALLQHQDVRNEFFLNSMKKATEEKYHNYHMAADITYLQNKERIHNEILYHDLYIWG